MTRTGRIVLIAVVVVLAAAQVTHGGLVRLDVRERSVVLGGRPFGAAGSYERIIGRAYFAVDPDLAANQVITDLRVAPRNNNGLVEFSADFYMLKPRDLRKGNGAVFLEPPNRGNKWLFQLFNRSPDSLDPRKPSDFGDGFLLRQGYTVLWVGWQFDVGKGIEPLRIANGSPNGDVLLQRDLLRLYAPVVEGVKGVVRAEITEDRKVFSESVSDFHHDPYPVLNSDDPNLKLTVKDRVEGPRQIVPREDWHIQDRTNIVLKTGFEPGRIYELVYLSENPPVAGVGFAAIRDTISWLKYGGVVSGAPTIGRVPRAYGFGISETGRFFRSFLYQGFNRDEKDRMVFDGILDDVAGGGRGSFNTRFAQPSRTTALYPVTVFPFADLDQQDPFTGIRDGLLTHSLPQNFWPRIFYLNAATEYYERAASLIHTTIGGKADAPVPSSTRIYFFSGAQHLPAEFPPALAGTANPLDPVEWTWTFRALLVAMDAWVRTGKEPPPSRYPSIRRKELVPLADLAFPKIPGVRFPTIIRMAYPENFGPEFLSRGIVTQEPPEIGEPYAVMVPQVDGDGNDIAGVRMPEVQVPLATYTGWNLRSREIGAPEQIPEGKGSFIPFPVTKVERVELGEPRLSIEERYVNRRDYIAKFEAAARGLARDGYLLRSDVPAVVKRGYEIWDYLHSDRR